VKNYISSEVFVTLQF